MALFFTFFRPALRPGGIILCSAHDGGVRTVTGEVVKLNSEGFSLSSLLGTAGIRASIACFVKRRWTCISPICWWPMLICPQSPRQSRVRTGTPFFFARGGADPHKARSPATVKGSRLMGMCARKAHVSSWTPGRCYHRNCYLDQRHRHWVCPGNDPTRRKGRMADRPRHA